MMGNMCKIQCCPQCVFLAVLVHVPEGLGWQDLKELKASETETNQGEYTRQHKATENSLNLAIEIHAFFLIFLGLLKHICIT